MQKRYLVFGAGGSIGSEVVKQLQAAGHHPISAIRYAQKARAETLETTRSHWFFADDVSSYFALKETLNTSFPNTTFDGVVYCVGHCPPHGFAEAIKYPLSKLPRNILIRDIQMHQLGVLNVFQSLLDQVNPGGCFLFVSSAITRLTDDQWPPFLQAHYHAASVSAEDWLIRGMRMDPAVKERGINIHRIAPGAVDTPFHQGGKQGPPKLVPLAAVGAAIVQALESETTVDRELLP